VAAGRSEHTPRDILNIAAGIVDAVFPSSDPTTIVTYRDGTRNVYIGEGPSSRNLADFATLAVGGAPRSLPRPANVPNAPKPQVNTGVNKVFQSIDVSGNVHYVGITNNLERRAAEQLRQKGIEIDAIPGLQNLSRFDAKAVEQVLIDTFGLGKNGGTLLNKINTIATSNPTYTQAIARGRDILKIIGVPIP
jgi:hypothetical protein